MRTNKLIGWFIILFALVLFAILISTLSTKEPQGRLIKPFPKDTTVNRHPECNACRIAHEYSLNINLKHYGE